MDLLTEEELARIKEMPFNAELDKMIKLYEFFAISPVVESYITLYNQISDINEQLTIREVEVEIEGKMKKKVLGRIDITDSEEKGFERILKYFDKIVDYVDALDKLRLRMLPQQQIDLQMQRKIDKLRKN